MMAVPPAPFIVSASVPEAGCMSDVNSSVLRDRYLQQHNVKHIYLCHCRRTFRKAQFPLQ
jgi:hypothetical protein